MKNTHKDFLQIMVESKIGKKRSRKDIEFDFEHTYKGNAPLTKDLKEILEVLLDIRDLMIKNGGKSN